jgi:alkaline phosphatase
VHQELVGQPDYCVKNAGVVRGILEASGKVLAVFSGHNHHGNYTLLNKIHYITIKAMVTGSGPQNNSYVIVELDSNHNLTITGFYHESCRTLPAA